MKFIVAAVVVMVMVTGCASTRTPAPVNMKCESDATLKCEQIKAEYEANTRSASAKIAKNNKADITDAFIGILIWPGLADFKNADGNEGNALLDRNMYLKELAAMQGCDVADFAPQPKRY